MAFFAISGHNAEAYSKRIAFLPFYDESGYRGPWQLRHEVPLMLGDMLMDDYYYVVELDSVITAMGPKQESKSILSKFFNLFSNRHNRQKILTDGEIMSIARKVNADYVVVGIIEEFTYKRSGMGEPMIGGYKSYTAEVNIEQIRVLNVLNGTVMATIRGNDKKNSRGLGLELFGKPRRLDLEFYSLDSLDFGSKRFLNSLIGFATIEALNNAQKEIRNALVKPDDGWFKEKNFKIISMESGTVTINAGTADGVKAGDLFSIYAPDSNALVGKVNITNVWSDHLSKAEIITGKDEIRPNDYILPSR